MKNQYPDLVYSEVGIMLKQHNAITFKMIADAKDSILKENLRFLDKIAPKLENRCTCCLQRSIPCLLQHNTQGQSPNASSFTTPDPKFALKHRRLYNNDSEADIPTASSSTKRKALHSSHDRTTVGTSSFHTPESSNAARNKSNQDTIKSWADTIAGGIFMYNDDISIPVGSVILGQSSAQPTEKIVVNHSHYAMSHWSLGATIDFPSIAYQDRLATTIYRLHIADKERFSITHPSPRAMPPFPRTRFCTSVLSNDKAWLLKSVQDQFFGKLVPYNISQCRMWHVPAILESGWAVFTWDMLSKTIYILDATSGLTSQLKKTHEIVADKLHVALFACILNFFGKWHVDCSNWKKKFPFLTTSLFPKNESGVCSIHLARHFNGTSLEEILTHDGLFRERGFLLHQILLIKGNISNLPQPLHEALVSN
ncbi:hypothetical protein VPH35_107526 [Triticum aestivum]